MTGGTRATVLPVRGPLGEAPAIARTESSRVFWGHRSNAAKPPRAP